jgi:galactarate dehydratase
VLDRQVRLGADLECARAGREAEGPPATPASDFICGTLQLAAGMNLHVFTPRRGTPCGLAAVPVIEVATRSDLARRWHGLMDVNAGSIADGTAMIEDVAGSCSA